MTVVVLVDGRVALAAADHRAVDRESEGPGDHEAAEQWCPEQELA
jgi:hypothetical protein